MAKNPQRNIRIALTFSGLLVLALLSYIGYRINISGRRLIPISVISVIAGIVFESRRLSGKWLTVLQCLSGALLLSLFVFLPGKGEHGYSLENHIEVWPYWFIVIFAIISIITHGDKVTPKLTEGITLLQSIAVVYWVVDYGFAQSNNFFIKLLIIIGLLFSLYSAFHALTHAVLSRTSRLTLSIWSTLIMMLFAIDNIYRVYQNEQIENTADITSGLYIGLQFFLLGVSSIYIVQNFLMLMGFLPGKGTFFNKQYFTELWELKNEHIKRYSDRQVSILNSLICLLLTSAAFALNYYYQFVPRHVAIGLCL